LMISNDPFQELKMPLRMLKKNLSKGPSRGLADVRASMSS
jgi:hypothetical protein